MEKQKATFKVFSYKTGGVCLDLGDGEAFLITNSPTWIKSSGRGREAWRL